MNNLDNSIDNLMKVLTWMNERMNSLPIEEQLMVVGSVLKMANEIKPIYEKDLKRIELEKASKTKDIDDLDSFLESLIKKNGGLE